MRILLLILIALSLPCTSHAADGVVDMTWDGCAGPIERNPAPADFLSLFLTVHGINREHRAYDVRFVYGNEQLEVPDAWRFDADGCEGSTLIEQQVTVRRTCPAFMHYGAGALQIRKVSFSSPTDPYATSLMSVLLANVYPSVTANPDTTYLLERVRFDLSYAVPGVGDPPNTCGGFEQGMCFKLTWATYLDLAGTEISFGRARQPILSVTVNQPSACAGLPARATTWGAIKGQYR